MLQFVSRPARFIKDIRDCIVRLLLGLQPQGNRKIARSRRQRAVGVRHNDTVINSVKIVTPEESI